MAPRAETVESLSLSLMGIANAITGIKIGCHLTWNGGWVSGEKGGKKGEGVAEETVEEAEAGDRREKYT